MLQSFITENAATSKLQLTLERVWNRAVCLSDTQTNKSCNQSEGVHLLFPHR